MLKVISEARLRRNPVISMQKPDYQAFVTMLGFTAMDRLKLQSGGSDRFETFDPLSLQ